LPAVKEDVHRLAVRQLAAHDEDVAWPQPVQQLRCRPQRSLVFDLDAGKGFRGRDVN
jgi:hypothetical protein